MNMDVAPKKPQIEKKTKTKTKKQKNKKNSIILEIGHISIFQKLELLIIVPRVLARYLAPKISEIVPTHIKELDTIDKFKIAIKKWKAKSCPCSVCKVYLQNIGYI